MTGRVRGWLRWADRSAPGRRFPLRALAGGDRRANQDHVRALAKTVTIHPGMAVTRVLGRYKMYVDPSDYAISVHLMFDGYWEMWLTEEIARTVQPGMVAADIGANLGYFTLLMADLVGPQGRVVAFEPNVQVTALLRRSLHANGFEDRVTIAPDPLGRTSGERVNLYFNPEQAGGAFVTSGERDDFSVGVAMTTRRFDDHPDAMRVAFAKIDAEGSEEAIWAGMAGSLAGAALRTVVMEYCGCRYSDPPGFVAAMTAHGFTLALLEPDRGIVPVTAEQLLAADPMREWLLVLRR